MAVSYWQFNLLILLSLARGFFCNEVEITPKHLVVKPGEEVTILCKVKHKIQYCRFEFISGSKKIKSPFNLNPGRKDQSVIYYGSGFQNGECGANITRAEDQHNGQITCSVGSEEFTYELSATMNLVVTRTPSLPELEVKNYKKNYFLEGEVLSATCTVKNARPVANISWYLDGNLISEGLHVDVVSVQEDLQTIMQNISHVTEASDDGKTLRCVAYHPGLSAANNYAQKVINVKYQPKPSNEPIERFGLVEGSEVRISVLVQANPRPNFIWTIGDITLYEQESKNRFTSQKAVDQGNGSWESVLIIDSLTKEDVEQEYTLKAQNEIGVTDYRVLISTSPPPQVFKMKTGTIIIILVVALVIIFVISAILCARSRGHLCFSGGDSKKEVSPPPEGTENPAITHHASSEYINNSPEMKKEKPKEDTPV
uniref:Ig-like domain-containing protein n=1 Tax=Clastoptera arizonana TaxID=38151 RepID=A0A1B6BZV0_9HEMI